VSDPIDFFKFRIEIGVCADGDQKTPHNPVGVVGQKNEQLLPQKCRSGTA
jgi:hypothetical protein